MRRRLPAAALGFLALAFGAGAGTAPGPLAGEAGTYAGLAGSTPAAFGAAVAFKIRVASSGAFAGSLVLGPDRYAVRGVLDGSGAAGGVVLRRAGSPDRTLSLALDLGEGDEDLHGEASGAGPVATLLGSRLLFTARRDPPPPLVNVPEEWPGAYGVRFTALESPGGDNGTLIRTYARMTVSPAGKVVVAGELPDGTRFRARSSVLTDGTVPIFVPLHRRGGSLSGRIPIPGVGEAAGTTGNAWFRPADPADPRFPDGWPAGLDVSFVATRGYPDLRTLTVVKTGTGTGTVTSSPPGIDFGPVSSVRLPVGTVVTLTAAADPENAFDGWSGAGTGDGARVVTLDADATVIAAFRSDPYVVDIDLEAGLVTFPNVWSGWQLGGGAATHFVAYPSGWTVGGGPATNYVAVPPGWSVGGAPATNFTAVPPGWSVGGGAATNFVAVPPGWSVGGAALTHYVALPPGWSAGGGSLTNFTALPPGWSAGGGAPTNFVALPPGWSVGGAAGTNYFAYPPGRGWTTGGGSLTNLTGLAPGWAAGGGATSNFVAMPPGWVAAGGAATGFVTHPGPSVTAIQLKFDDPGWLACFRVLQDSGDYTDRQLADIVLAAFLNLRKTAHFRAVPTEANAGDW